jgi:ribonucleoside-diphosphate reductase alpha chain
MASRGGYTLRFSVGDAAGTLTTAAGADGQLRDVFLRVGKQGSTVAGLADALAGTISVALHYGVPLAALADELSGTHYTPSGPTDDPELPWATSLTDYVSRRLAADYPAPTPDDRSGARGVISPSGISR